MQTRTLEQWAGIIEEMQLSGMPQKKWCEDHNINWGSMHAAHMRLNKSRRQEKGRTPRFVRVTEADSADKVTFRCAGFDITATPHVAAAILTHLAGEADVELCR